MAVRCIAIALLFLLVLSTVYAHKRYESRIPNARGHILDGKSCKASGHLTCSGKGHTGKKLNQFGDDFKRAGKRWTRELCLMDSDGDGLTNGQELGDPCCVWQPGGQPARTHQLSHPSHASSVNDAPGCDMEEVVVIENAITKQNISMELMGVPAWAWLLVGCAGLVSTLVLTVSVFTMLMRLRSFHRAKRRARENTSVPLIMMESEDDAEDALENSCADDGSELGDEREELHEVQQDESH